MRSLSFVSLSRELQHLQEKRIGLREVSALLFSKRLLKHIFWVRADTNEYVMSYARDAYRHARSLHAVSVIAVRC